MTRNPIERTVAMILAGGAGNRLSILAERRAKPAVPFGGIYRVIDFTLSNVMHTGIKCVGIMTQYKPYSLMDHFSDGAAWGFTGRKRLAKVLPPYVGGTDSDWYAGTADAVFQNLSFINRFDHDLVLVLSGDHIYSVNYADMIQYHIEKQADLTIAMQAVPQSEVGRFGIGVMNDEGRIVDFHEKTPDAPSNKASLGIYIFNRKMLEERLIMDSTQDTAHDFAKNIIPPMLKEDNVYGWDFEGYWRDIGTVRSYWESNMEALDVFTGCDLNAWKVHTNLLKLNHRNYVPAKIEANAEVRKSIVSPGCHIMGIVENSVLSPGVIVEKGARVKDSVVFHDCFIGKKAEIQDTICDKEVVIDSEARIGFGNDTINETAPSLLNSGLTLIGKKVCIPKGKTIGRNCLIYPSIDSDTLSAIDVRSGTTVEAVIKRRKENK